VSDQAPPTLTDTRGLRRVVGAASIGTFVEYYDFALYGAASALVFGPLFFPQYGAAGGTLASFAVYAVAFLVRPLGGLAVAHVGDRLGRKPVLIFTVTLMGVATVSVGLLPTYESIGIWAPILLVTTRLLQGLGAGAEIAGAVTAIAEFTPIHRRAFYTSFVIAAVGAALVVSTGSFAILATLPRDVLLDWGWRVPFLASVVLIFVAVFIRRRTEETPAFVRVTHGDARNGPRPVRIPLFSAIQERPRALIIGMLSGSGPNVLGYAITAFSLSYITQTLHMPITVATLGVVAAGGTAVLTVPLGGWLADRFGRRPLLAFGAIFTAIFIWPYFILLDVRHPATIITAMATAYGIGTGAMYGAHSAFVSELFETRYRLTGIAASREINTMLLGGTTPFIATALVPSAGGFPWLVALFIATSQLLTLLAVAFAPQQAAQCM
jgi:MFS transporter, MHS family, shikimate and dehydroshikimate transport protein